MFKSPARIRIDYRGISDPDHPAVNASRLIAEVIGISNQVRACSQRSFSESSSRSGGSQFDAGRALCPLLDEPGEYHEVRHQKDWHPERRDEPGSPQMRYDLRLTQGIHLIRDLPIRRKLLPGPGCRKGI